MNKKLISNMNLIILILILVLVCVLFHKNKEEFTVWLPNSISYANICNELNLESYKIPASPGSDNSKAYVTSLSDNYRINGHPKCFLSNCGRGPRGPAGPVGNPGLIGPQGDQGLKGCCYTKILCWQYCAM